MSYDEDPTFESHLAFHTPFPAWVDDREWNWSFRKFGYEHGGVLFTELHEEFNSFKCAIQDPYGWHLDVREIADLADNREEFFSLLRDRRKERFDEIYQAWEQTTSLLVGEPDRWDKELDRVEMWLNFMRISRNFSYDSILNFFGEYVKDHNSQPGADVSNPPNPERNPPRHLINQTSFEASNTRSIELERPSQRLKQKSRAARPRTTRTRAPRTRGSKIAKVSVPATDSPNRITRKTQQRNNNASDPGGPRRSSRIREKRERAEREGR
ncbi:hypothetical protein O1611_g2395 [Lasiodiplodia mahajangana]|uniref:Uncharacterized protein n=1 Tax=Lasiodiplodia mahajangana TaxID=1108764 RepID=A0ACC2JVC8_9PEZI|nr:hypothetical protein O1611_g2395 [Lasiodiplodia mahajangana]